MVSPDIIALKKLEDGETYQHVMRNGETRTELERYRGRWEAQFSTCQVKFKTPVRHSSLDVR